MTVFITLLLFVIAFAFIAYPYFSKTVVTREKGQAVTSGNTKRPKPEKITGPARDIDAEIEKRIQDIRRNKQRFCPQCGAENKDTSRFCSQCGEKLPGRDNEE